MHRYIEFILFWILKKDRVTRTYIRISFFCCRILQNKKHESEQNLKFYWNLCASGGIWLVTPVSFSIWWHGAVFNWYELKH